MQVQFADRLTIDRSHRTKDGYMKVVAKGARAGIQQYLGREVDPEGKHFAADQVVNVYRPPEEVFAPKAIASFIGKPVTDDHPAEAVTAKNWRDHTRGVIGGAVKDGEWMRFEVALMDADLVSKVEAGKRELSGGYACDLAIESGRTADGQEYQAVQRGIVGNHLAVVDRARAGSEARICDGGNDLFQSCDAATVIFADGAREAANWLRKAIALHRKHMDGTAPTTGKAGEKSQMLMMEQMENALAELEEGKPSSSKARGMKMDWTGESKMPHTLVIDGLQVPNVSDEAKAAIEKLQGQVKDGLTQVATLTTDKATLEAKVTTLEKQVADAKITPQQLRDAARAYQQTVDKAKALGVAVTDAMDEPAIQRAVVNAKIGDAAKDWTDAQVAASFATLTADAKASDPVRQVLSDGLSGLTSLASVRDAARMASLN